MTSFLNAAYRLLGITMPLSLGIGLLAAYHEPVALEGARQVGLALGVAALASSVRVVVARIEAWRGDSRPGEESGFVTVVLGGIAVAALYLLGMPHDPIPSPLAAHVVRFGAVALAVLALIAGGVGLVLGIWARSAANYLGAQLLMQGAIGLLLGSLWVLWRGANAILP